MEARAGAALAWLKWMYVFSFSLSLLPLPWLPWYHALDTDPRLEAGGGCGGLKVGGVVGLKEEEAVEEEEEAVEEEDD